MAQILHRSKLVLEGICPNCGHEKVQHTFELTEVPRSCTNSHCHQVPEVDKATGRVTIRSRISDGKSLPTVLSPLCPTCGGRGFLQDGSVRQLARDLDRNRTCEKCQRISAGGALGVMGDVPVTKIKGKKKEATSVVAEHISMDQVPA